MGEVSPLNQLYRRFHPREFEFFSVYVREPHPGEYYSAHRSWEQKLEYARQCRVQDGIEVPLLVDSLDGALHRLYGMLPNMVYVIDKDGRIVYKATWTDHVELEAMLENVATADELRSRGVRLRSSYVEKISYLPPDSDDGVTERVFERAGPRAREDFQKVVRPTS